MPGAVVIGAGPGIGRAVVQRFAREGLPTAVISRSAADVGAELALTADSTDEEALRGALDAVTSQFGLPDVVVYNAALVQADALGELSVRGHLDAWAVNVVGAATTAAHVLPAMARRGSGTFIITGGMPRPKPEYVSLSLGKAGVWTLVALLDQQFGAAGVHVASVTVDGAVVAGTGFDPGVIAEHYWRLHEQGVGEWELEVVHG
ncbi:SDR family NAD(P)-dependent oxidoreductase [Allokutzneria sp. A3M-2-11 16]|uniref:SDR family NAD(P)-dependent oxidoreductase n=1 Tax=Allokutzneria sp. A3M-2-11 16 TaxID=2962043 RepID=UPI0020B71839|nr:SDR family NAD(P)-dependent oxidoreductase [Allokutzneria sp. A3M-2-11 16]MCP3804586.1 SDR family NAD(P)-dependent oxidoreductase [Allokutzneria sp. A3M-2-11 16]